MSKNKYYLSTYSASSLIKKYQVVKCKDATYDIRYEIDYTIPRVRKSYLLSTNLTDDTAMYYQFRKLMNIKDDEATPDDLLQEIIVVDFHCTAATSLFDGLKPATPEMFEREYTDEASLKPWSDEINDDFRLRKLFDNGIYINYGDKVVHYVPFDKSNSMARDNKITFVNEERKDILTRRLNLDIDFEKIEVTLSKYYAYRGLYLTTADRFDTYRNELMNYFNENTVIIVPDSILKKHAEKMITGERESAESTSWKPALKDSFEKNFEAFDGEGLISPELAREINKECGYDNAYSFQIRMPFAKGMLHTVDFKKFIREEIIEDPNLDEYLIEDAYGITKNIMDAHIIMPVTMFKCDKWLMKMFYPEEMAEFERTKEKDDPRRKPDIPMPECMPYYFEKFHEYNHCMYISNTDKYYGNKSRTQLNYQFFNTLDMMPSEVKALLNSENGQNYYIENPIEYYKLNSNDKAVESDDAYEDSSDEYEEEEENLSWLDALIHNPVLAHERMINTMLKTRSESLKRDIAYGRIMVDGEMRYLSRDLLRFVINVVDLNDSDAFDNIDIRDNYDKVSSMLLGEDYFYLPNSKITLKEDKNYSLFRNPHLSRNEQCISKAYIEKGEDDIYRKYFSHLKGVVMVGYRSLIPQALGGADFDGDIAKIIANDIVCTAVARGILDKKKVNRKLPIIDIPDASKGKESKSGVPKNISYDVIKDTFSSRVGRISNLSVRIGDIEYNPKPRSKPKHSCAECTINTGLEIDAAKSGEHPDLSDILDSVEITGDSRKNLSGDYIFFKDRMTELYGKRISFVHVEKDGVDLCYRSKADAANERAVPLYVHGTNSSKRALNTLPKCFFDSLDIKMNIPGELEGNRYVYFDFLRDANWAETIDSAILEKAGAIIKAYYDVNRLAVRVNNYQRQYANHSYGGHINTILNMQYGEKEAAMIIDKELDNLYEYVADCFEALIDVRAAITYLTKCKWAFVRPCKRAEVLANILMRDIEDSESISGQRVIELLCNSEAQGYNLLFYILRELESEYVSQFSDEEVYKTVSKKVKISEARISIDENLYDSTYSKLYGKLTVLRDFKRSDAIKYIYGMCVDMLNDICENLSDYDRLKLFWQLGAIDTRHEFFWDMVPIKCINEHKAQEVK